MDSIPFRLQIELILLVLCFIYFIYRYVHKKKISVQYSIVWFISAFVMLGCAILPKVLGWLTNILGIEKISNMLFLGGFLILFVIAFSLTVIVSNLRLKVTVLTQELAILKKQVEEGKK